MWEALKQNLAAYLTADSEGKFGICCAVATQLPILNNPGMLNGFLSTSREVKVSVLGSENAVNFFEDCNEANKLMLDLLTRKLRGEKTVTLTAPPNFGERK